MRTKTEIMDRVQESRSTVYREDCLLEVLLDIRDILKEKPIFPFGTPNTFQGLQYTTTTGHIHESDGNIYTSNPPQSKCKTCGKFY